VGAGHDVRPGGGELVRELALRVGRAPYELGSPVQVDNHDISGTTGGAHRGDQPRRIERRCHTGLARARREVCRGRVGHVVGTDDGDPRPSDRCDVRSKRRVGVSTDAHDRERSVGRRAEGVVQALRSIVDTVVVRHGHDVDASRRNGLERRGRGSEREVLLLGRSARRHGGLQVGDGEVGRRELGPQRRK
jgi:hypothetical protein